MVVAGKAKGGASSGVYRTHTPGRLAAGSLTQQQPTPSLSIQPTDQLIHPHDGQGWNLSIKSNPGMANKSEFKCSNLMRQDFHQVIPGQGFGSRSGLIWCFCLDLGPVFNSGSG